MLAALAAAHISGHVCCWGPISCECCMAKKSPSVSKQRVRASCREVHGVLPDGCAATKLLPVCMERTCDSWRSPVCCAAAAMASRRAFLHFMRACRNNSGSKDTEWVATLLALPTEMDRTSPLRQSSRHCYVVQSSSQQIAMAIAVLYPNSSNGFCTRACSGRNHIRNLVAFCWLLTRFVVPCPCIMP